MFIYDIHTHNHTPSSDNCNGYVVIAIQNTSPYQFRALNDDSKGRFYSCGIHPWYLDDADAQYSMLTDIVYDDRIIAIGEAGLDRLADTSIITQIAIFEKQIQLANTLSKPLIIHCVKAWEDLIALSKTYRPSQWILHGYRGKPEQAKQLVKEGMKFSVGEMFNAETLKAIPITSLFCETDDSEISICDVYNKVSDTLGISFDELTSIIQKNVIQTFGENCNNKNITL